jgi:hypothetical protein
MCQKVDGATEGNPRVSGGTGDAKSGVTMRKSVVLSIAVIVGLAIAARPREAKACGGVVSGDVVAAALVVTGAYAGTTIGMGIHDLTSDNPSVGYGVAEGLIHTPIALAFGAAFIDDISQPEDPYYDQYDDDNSEIWLGAFTALHATLAIHGWYTATKHRTPRSRAKDLAPPPPVYGPPGMVKIGSVRADVTLTPVSSGRSVGGGIGLAGTF